VTVALRGNLSDFGIGEVFQLIGQQRKTGVLEVDGATGDRIHVGFVDGSVVTAALVGPHEDAALGDMLVRSGLLTAERLLAIEQRVEAEEDTFRRLAIHQEGLAARDVDQIEDLVTRETLFELLRWTTGSFHFSAQKVRTRTPETRGSPAEQILMDGLRMLDEWRELVGRVPSENTVFQRFGTFESFVSKSSEEATPARIEAARRVFGLIDGRLSVRRVIDLALVGNFEGMRLFTALHESGEIQAVRVAGGASLGMHGGGFSVLPALRSSASAILPLGLLALAVMLAAQYRAPSPPAHPIERSSLEAVREGHATRRLSAAIDTYRLLAGRFPDELEALASRGVVDLNALAAPEGRPYYSALRADGVILLAPEH